MAGVVECEQEWDSLMFDSKVKVRIRSITLTILHAGVERGVRVLFGHNVDRDIDCF